VVAYASRMKPEARALCQALLDHHSARTKALPPGKNVVVTKYTVRYGDLCARAGLPHLTRVVGAFLGEVGAWCAAEGYPPLDVLAVGETGLPGERYDGASRFTRKDWPHYARECICFASYPAKMP
jgi:hypothetical protein